MIIRKDGSRSRSRRVENDYAFYDPPGKILEKIKTGEDWPYKHPTPELEDRDRALPALLYLTCCRVSEPLQARVSGGELPGIKPEDFVEDGDMLKLRNLPIIKRKGVVNGGYPKRREIVMMKTGELSALTQLIMQHLENTPTGTPLWSFTRTRAYQIVSHMTGETDHYFRAMGLKFYSRLFDRNIKDLQDFSGHVRVDNLVKYLGEGNVEAKLKEAKLW